MRYQVCIPLKRFQAAYWLASVEYVALMPGFAGVGMSATGYGREACVSVSCVLGTC